jgi:hypothetical protein
MTARRTWIVGIDLRARSDGAARFGAWLQAQAPEALEVIGLHALKAEDGGLTLYSRRGGWRDGKRLYPADAADPWFLLVDDDDLAPSAIALVRDPDGVVTGLRCNRLVEMARTEAVGPWA